MRRPTTATALYLTGAPGTTWRVQTADGATYEVQFAATSQPTIVRRGSDVASDRHPRRLAALEAVLGEPLRFTITGRERFEAVVTGISRVRPYCVRCGERLFGICTRCLVDASHHYAETKWVGKPLTWRRRMVNRLEPLFRLLDGR
ncbi:hypothetical protein ABIB54_003444 [Frigoribacterium sp. UYMn621]